MRLEGFDFDSPLHLVCILHKLQGWKTKKIGKRGWERDMRRGREGGGEDREVRVTKRGCDRSYCL